MSSVTAADLKLGGRIIAACDAIGAGHLRRAAGIFNEIADDLNSEAEATTGLLAKEYAAQEAELPEVDQTLPTIGLRPPPSPPTKQVDPMDLQSCARDAHSFGPPDPISGWHTCLSCGIVWVSAPGDNQVDMSARQ